MPSKQTLQTPSHLQLSPCQIRDHLPARDPRRPPQRREVQRARKRVRVAEAQHGRDPTARVLEREARIVHLVLLDRAATQVVHASLRVDLRLVRAWAVCQLRPGEDVEVVVGCVPARVPFGADGGTCKL